MREPRLKDKMLNAPITLTVSKGDVLVHSAKPGHAEAAVNNMNVNGPSCIGIAITEKTDEGAGTVEFLLDVDGCFYFMEMNTRLQVEHPVTEMITGVDIVKEQLLIAGGQPLSIKQSDIKFNGHSIECRINAEDPDRNFMPSPGDITQLHIPGGPGVRVDTHIYSDYLVPPYYDSLLAKVIVHGKDRQEAVARMRRALAECVFEGLPTSTPFHIEVLNNPVFLEGKATKFRYLIGFVQQQALQFAIADL